MTSETGDRDPYARTIFKFAAMAGINTAGKDPIQVLSDWAERDQDLLRERGDMFQRVQEIEAERAQRTKGERCGRAP